MADVAPVLEKDAAQDHPFIKGLIKVWRAQDTHGAWESKSDLELISPYIVDKEARRALPIIGDLDDDHITLVARLEEYRSLLRLAHGRPVLRLLYAVVYRVSHAVDEGIEEVFDNRFIELGLFTFDDEINLF